MRQNSRYLPVLMQLGRGETVAALLSRRLANLLLFLYGDHLRVLAVLTSGSAPTLPRGSSTFRCGCADHHDT